MESADGILDDIPLPPHVSTEDVTFAVRAISVHAPEPCPDGPRCRNDQAPHPCRLHRWGRRLLAERGLTDRQIRALIAEQEATHQ
ncbi:hypothetical protein ACQPYA_07905 [Micromonospora sp. CA-263727]|uniref:hypothetical protein n=1 Tax=Micromonospora sp. CA-263727 TaxID=3239967 RepID=UPI003D93CF69